MNPKEQLQYKKELLVRTQKEREIVMLSLRKLQLSLHPSSVRREIVDYIKISVMGMTKEGGSVALDFAQRYPSIAMAGLRFLPKILWRASRSSTLLKWVATGVAAWLVSRRK